MGGKEEVKLVWGGRQSYYSPGRREITVSTRDTRGEMAPVTLAHELAHWRLGHTEAYESVFDEIQEEVAAWAFAIDEGLPLTVKNKRRIKRSLETYRRVTAAEYGYESSKYDDVDSAIYEFTQAYL